MNPFAQKVASGASPSSASSRFEPVGGITFTPPPAKPSGPSTTLWLVGVGGVVLLSSLVVVVVVTSPKEDVAARRAYRRRAFT